MKEIALVTGASRGIGKAVALELARDGFHIWLNYASNHEKAKEVQDEILSLGRDCRLLPFDISDKEKVFSSIQEALSSLSPEEKVTVLVNNAGIIRDNIFSWMQVSEWEEVIHTNLDGFFYVTKALLDHFQENRTGSIVNISSISGVMGNYGQTNYSAAKAGLIAAGKALSKELGRSKIRVNTVVPGIIDTDMAKEMTSNAELKKMIPLKRFGKPQEVAWLVSFLCSSKASYITGAVMPVTGGLFV